MPIPVQKFSFLLVLCLFLPLFTVAANLQSVMSGPWNVGATWGGSVPAAGDQVTVSNGHIVEVLDGNPAIVIASLNVQASGKLLLGKANFTVNGQTQVFGQILDMAREGINHFKGLATFHSGSKGDFLLSWGTGGIVKFENGLVHHGDSLNFRRVEFLVNSQQIAGSSLVMITERLDIGNGVTLTNATTGGLFFKLATVNGLGGNAVFRNESFVNFSAQIAPMVLGQVDFTPSGNEVWYSSASDQQVLGAEYARLIIKQDTNSLFRNRYLIGDVTVSEYLMIEGNGRLEPKNFDLTVNGLTEIYGRLNDLDFAGINTFQDVNLWGEFTGNVNGYGTYHIQGDLEIKANPSNIRDANLQIQGTTFIRSGTSLAINSNNGPRVFGNMLIEQGGTFDSRSDNGVEIAGTVTNNGSFLWKYGILSGSIVHNGDTAWANKFVVSGPNAEITGSGRFWIKDQVNLDSAAILTNNSSGGLYLYDRAKLIGNHPSATFRSKGLVHNQTDNVQMEVGFLDANYPGSVFHFDRQLNLGQRLSPGHFYDVEVLGGQAGSIRRISFAIDTMKVFHHFSIGMDAKFEPQKGSLICYGDAVIRGELFDGDSEGIIEFHNVDVSGVKFTGSNNNYGTFRVSGEMKVESGDFEMHNGALTITGKMTIAPGRLVTVTSRNGKRDFGSVDIAAGAWFDDRTGGDTIRFSGTVINEGRFNVTFPLLNGILDVQSDTTTLFAPLFEGYAVLRGSRPLVLKNKALILRNSRMVNRLDSLVFADKSLFVGIDSSSVFENRGTMYWENRDNFLPTATMDCSQGPNTIVYRYRQGDLDLRPGTYWHLDLPTDPTRNLPKRRIPVAGITTLGNFILGGNVELQLRKANLTVGNTAYIYGKVYDDEQEGEFRANNMVLGNALVDGQTNLRYGRVVVENELILNWGESNWERADLTVLGTVVVTDSAILRINGNIGTRAFKDIRVGEKSLLVENGNGQNITVTGKVELSGELNLSFGNYTFEDQILVHEGGKFISGRTGSVYAFLDTLEVHGLMDVPQGTLQMKGPLLGTGNLILRGDLSIPAKDTLVNEMTGDLAFMMRGGFKATDNSSHFINKGIFRYGPANNARLMEDAGTYDFLSHPDNWIIFDAAGGFQSVPADSFLNVGFENGGSKTIAGDSLKILGDMVFSVDLRKDPNVFSSGIVLFVGEQDQTISGKGIGSMENMVVRKDGGSLTVMSDFAIREGLVMKKGVLMADPGAIALGGGAFIQESEVSYILGRVGSERNISQGQEVEFGGMGLTIKPVSANMGPTLVYRITGRAAIPGQIDRYYEVYATNNQGLNATVEVGYHEREINGAEELDLQVVHQVFSGQEFDVLGGRVYRNSNYVRKVGIDQLGTISLVPQTVAINAYPSPFTGSSFTVSFTLQEDDPEVDLRIFDLAGRQWAQMTVPGLAGKNEILFDKLNLSAGTYIIRMVAEERTGYKYVQKLTP